MIKKHHRLMWAFTGSVLKSFKRPVFIYLVTLAITVQILFATLFFHLESEANPNMPSFFDAFYFTVTVMTGVGLGDIHAVTTLGKVVSMLMMLSGTIIFVTFTAVLAASILQIEAEHLQKKD
jgi:voltage-gated potassium channel